jgi:hypothetical protein
MSSTVLPAGEVEGDKESLEQILKEKLESIKERKPEEYNHEVERR